MNDPVSVLDIDAGLAELVPRERREQACQATAAATVHVSSGTWMDAHNAERARGGYGLLVLDGLLVRRVAIEGRYGAELLGPGDLLRPWQRDVNVLSAEWAWGARTPARPAQLDPPSLKKK
jgi:CRP/FNR family cyclic AMP-dependent transcriptional regulator